MISEQRPILPLKFTWTLTKVRAWPELHLSFVGAGGGAHGDICNSEKNPS